MKHLDALFDIAVGQCGFFTATQAQEDAGCSAQALQKHLKSGNIERVARGIYRLKRYPLDMQDDLIVLWLWSDQKGVFSHETALQHHELSDVFPSRIHMTLPLSEQRRRRKVPLFNVVLYYADVTDREISGAVPFTPPARSVTDVAKAHGSLEHVARAIDQGISRRLFSILDVAEAAACLVRKEPT